MTKRQVPVKHKPPCLFTGMKSSRISKAEKQGAGKK
jgi:hypothetical protein